jgi:SAM-dependent methyltransferase
MAPVDHLLQATARVESRHFWFKGLRRFATPLLLQATHGISDVRLLDCGCGTGANVAWLRQYGRAWGFDLTASGPELGRSLGRHGLARASITAIPFETGSFDVVTSFDVLYSLSERDEEAAVAEMYRVVKPGGYLIVNVAAMKALVGDHSVLSHELRRYSRSSIASALTRGGFRVLRATYTNMTLVPLLLIVRSLQRARGLAPEARADGDIQLPPAPVNALLSWLLTFEALWLRWVDEPFGSSLLCLAQKPREGGSPS